jgi:hypothetical protein
MLRAMLGSVCVVTIIVGCLAAADNPPTKATQDHAVTFVRADLVKNAITFLMTNKTGKQVEKTLPLDKHATILGVDNKPETLAALASNMGKEHHKSIHIVWAKDGTHVLQVRDLPGK